MTPEQQEMLREAIIALDEEYTTMLVDPDDVIALLRRVEELEARVEELRRRYEPTMAEQVEDMDAQAGACWG
jgi:tetrahydromethanopterin S-methyltransferase subunit G